MIQTMQSEQAKELTVEMNTEDHGTKGGPKPRPRLQDEKEGASRSIQEEFKAKLITRPVPTYDEILALIEAEIRELDELQRRELGLFDTKRKETVRELLVIDEEITREFARAVEKTREQIVEATIEPNHRVEATTNGSCSHDSGVKLDSPGSPPASAESSCVRDCSGGAEGSAGTRDVSARGTARNVSFRENTSQKASAAEESEFFSRIPQRKHQMEELVVEDVDTFYEDQTKSPKKKKKEKEEKKEGTILTKQTRRGLNPTCPSPALGATDHVTFVVSYDHPFGCKTGRKRNRNPFHSKKAKAKVKVRNQSLPTAKCIGQTMTYIVNHDRQHPDIVTGSGHDTVNARLREIPIRRDYDVTESQKHTASGEATVAATPVAFKHESEVKSIIKNRSLSNQEIYQLSTLEQKSPTKVLSEHQISQDSSAADDDWQSSELVAYMDTHYHSKYPVSTERLDLMTTVSMATEVVLPQAKASDNNAAHGNEVGIENKPTDGEELVAISGQRLAIAAVARSLHEDEEDSPTVTETQERVISDSITYVVNYDRNSLSLPKGRGKEKSKDSVSMEARPVPGLPSCDAFSKELQKETDKKTESMTYIVSYNVPEKLATVKQTMSVSPAARNPSERQEEVDEKRNQELTIVVEHPQINPEKLKTKNSVVNPASQLTIAVDQPQISAKAESHPKMKKPQTMISSSSVESNIRDNSESITYVINYDKDSLLKLPEKTKTGRKNKKREKRGEKVSKQREANLDSPSDDVTGADDSNARQKEESLTFVVSHDVPVSASSSRESGEEEAAGTPRPAVGLSAAEAEKGKPFQQLTISVERSVQTGKGPETSLPLSKRNEQLEPKSVLQMKARSLEGTSETKRTEPQRPRRSASEILTFIVNYEEPEIITAEKKDETKKGKGKIFTTPGDPTKDGRETDRKTESLTYIVEHIDKPRSKEGIHEEGEKKGRDWLWSAKKSNERIDLSTEGRTKIAPEIQTLPETCTYVVTCDYLASAADDKLWPFSKKTPSNCRVERKVSGEEKMRLLRKKSETETQEKLQDGSNIALPGVSIGLESKERSPVTEEFRVLEGPIGGELTAEVVESEEKISRKRKSRLDAEAKTKHRTGGGEEEEETVTYIVNYDLPFSSQRIETPVATERHTATDAKQQLFDQCILVPLKHDSSPEDGFYSAPVERFAGRVSPPPASPPPRPSIVVAVDIGTTFSGYAFAFGGAEEEEEVHVMRKWEGGDPGAVDHKTPTILLLTPDGRFHSFGFSARDFYHDLSPKEANRWLYFERFKMALHCSAQGLGPSTRLSAANGQSVPAVDVFSQTLRFFRDRVLQEIVDQDSTGAGGGGGCEGIIRWVITVPVIWTEEAKQFMRLAAYMAGIASPDHPDRLTIALEPEAAEMFVRKQRLDQMLGPDGAAAAAAKGSRRTHQRRAFTTQTTATANQTIGSGNRYMVVDCGGGSTDISVHEIQLTGGALRDLRGAVGAPFGSVAVDQEFEKLLVAIFGFDFIDAFKTKRPAGWVDLLMAFESRKRAANPHNAKPLNVSLPFSFIDYHKKFRNCPPDVVIRKFGDDGIRWSSHGMLRLMPDAMRRLFHPAIEGITEAITKTLKDCSSTDRGLKFLFLVGGFAESAMLQLAIRKRFGHLVKVILPNDASISVLKGAVHLGLGGQETATTTPRKTRMTYGVAVLNRFVRGQHPRSKVVARADDEWCADVFDAFVCADQPVAIGDSVVRRYALLLPDDGGDVTASALIGVYSSESNDVKYVTDEGVTRCGTLELSNDEGVRGREVQVRMTFGRREVEVTAVDLKTRKSVNFATDFHSR